jgi:hypothetical protein
LDGDIVHLRLAYSLPAIDFKLCVGVVGLATVAQLG